MFMISILGFNILCICFSASNINVVQFSNPQVPRQVPHKKPKQVCQQVAGPLSGQTGGFQLVGVGGTGTAAAAPASTGLLSGLTALTGR
jgi:hypothetical protein